MSQDVTCEDPAETEQQEGSAVRKNIRLIAALLTSATIVVPLVFSISTDETFVAPKLIILWLVLGAGVVLATTARLRARILGSWLLPDTLVVVYTLLLIFSFVFSVDWRQSLWGERFQRQGLLTSLLYVGFYFLARMAISERRRLCLLVRGVASGATVAAAYGVLQKLGLDPIWSLPNVRTFSTIGQPNALGAYLAGTTLLTAVIAVAVKDTRRRILWSTAAFVQALALVLTLSRGAYLALVVGLAVVCIGLWRTPSVNRRRLAGLAVATSVGVAIIVAVLPPTRNVAEQAVSRTVASLDIDQPGSVRMHLDAWKVGWEIASDHPLLGTGPDTYVLEFPAYRDSLLPMDQAAVFLPYRVESPHNVYLAVATGSGLPALAVYLGFVVSVLWRIRLRDDSLLYFGITAAVVAHLVSDLFMTAEVTGSWLFWLLLGTATRLHQDGVEAPEAMFPDETR